MPSVRLDKVIMSSLHGSFVNYSSPSPSNIVVSASGLGNGQTRTISVSIPYTRGGTVADIYATRGTIKTLISSAGRAAASAVYQPTSFETVRFDVVYSSSTITVSLIISNNTGSTITPIVQTITISVVQYDAPITNL